MGIPDSLNQNLALPAICAPMFIISNPGSGHCPVQGRHHRLVPSRRSTPGRRNCSTNG